VSLDLCFSAPAAITTTLPWKALATAARRLEANGATSCCLGSGEVSAAQLLPMYFTNALPEGRCDLADPRAANFSDASLLMELFCHFWPKGVSGPCYLGEVGKGRTHENRPPHSFQEL